MSENPNVDIWDAVCKTDPRHTKKIVGKPYQGTSPKPQWLYRRATEVFGPAGLGWGIKVLSQQIVDGCGEERFAFATVEFWYRWNGEMASVQHVGGTHFCGQRSKGPFGDEDAMKKSVTDATVKAMSLVGFAGDIFMGLYDDCKYVHDVAAEFRDQPVSPSKEAIDTDHSSESGERQLEQFRTLLAAAAGKGIAALQKEWTGIYELLVPEMRKRFLDEVLPPLKEKASAITQASKRS